MKLALRIDVDTFRGARDGVPRLVELLKRHGAGATFLVSLGPDHEGPFYGRVMPAPDIGRRCANALRAARDAGFEVGMQAWDRARWRSGAAKADAEWTARQMSLAMARFEDVFGERAAVHGAPAWQMNRHAFRNTQALSFDYASDTRGTHPFVPVVRGEIVACPQFPTTLPTLGEVANLAEELVAKSAPSAEGYPHHVFAARASLEGLRLLPLLQTLLDAWKGQGYDLVALRDLVREASAEALAMHRIVEGPVALQGAPYLPDSAPA